MKKTLLIILVIFIGAISINAQDNDKVNYAQYNHIGGYLHYVLNNHLADFSTLPGCLSCNPGFTSGFGNGFAVGGLFDFPLNDKNLFLGVRLGYTMRNANLTTEEKIGNGIDKGITAPGVTSIMVEHRLDSKVGSIDLEPQLIYNFYDNFNATLGVKGAYLITKLFSQKESIISPTNLVFDDTKTLDRNIYAEQEIPDVKSFLTFLTIGLSYNFRLESGLSIAPEVRYEFPLYSMSSVSWRPAAFNLGVAIKFPLIPSVKPVYDSTMYLRDTNEIFVEGSSSERIYLKTKDENLTTLEFDDYKVNRKVINELYVREIPVAISKPDAKITVRGVDLLGNYTAMPQLVIEEIETEETFPLLPQIFFENNSSDLTKTRINLLRSEQSSSFDEQKINWNTLSIYYEILNIVGKRMKENPRANLTITGCNNNIGAEANNLSLSKQRAEVVKEYLHNVWNISNNRLITVNRNLPAKQANNTKQEGIEENRSVELSSTNPEILKPIKLMDIQRTANPPIVRLYPNIQSKNNIDSWNVNISQSGTKLREFNGSGTPDSIDWVVETNPIPREEVPVNIALQVTDNNNQIGVGNTEVRISQKTIKKKKIEMLGDKKIERFSLILFDYDKNNVTSEQNIAIKQMKERIQSNSTITITGYADRTGEAEYNRELSLVRAKNVATALGLSEGKAKIIGAGSDVKLWDNDLPEGRSYSRTVKIIIETPIK